MIMNSVLNEPIQFQNYSVASTISYLNGNDEIPENWKLNLSIKTDISKVFLFIV